MISENWITSSKDCRIENVQERHKDPKTPAPRILSQKVRLEKDTDLLTSMSIIVLNNRGQHVFTIIMFVDVMWYQFPEEELMKWYYQFRAVNTILLLINEYTKYYYLLQPESSVETPNSTI